MSRPMAYSNFETLPCRCFICYRLKNGRTGEHPLLTNENDTAVKPQSPLDKNLFVMFVLRKLFSISSEDLSQYLEKFGEPASWIWLCKSCGSEIEDAENIHKQLLWLEKWFDKMKRKVLEKVKDSVDVDLGDSWMCSNDNNGMVVTDELRAIIMGLSEANKDKLPGQDVSVMDYGSCSKGTLPSMRTRQRKLGSVGVKSSVNPVKMKPNTKLVVNCSENEEIKNEPLSPAGSFTQDYNTSDADDDSNIEMDQNLEGDIYHCIQQNCSSYFHTKKDIRIHLVQDHGQAINKGRTGPLKAFEIEKCVVCDLSFPAYCFDLHVELHHSTTEANKNESENDNQKSATKGSQIATLSGQGSEGKPINYSCTICLRKQNSFRSQALLDEHLELHKSSPYHCYICLSVFRDGNLAYNHVYKYHLEHRSSLELLNKTRGVVKRNKVLKTAKCSKCSRYILFAQMSEHLKLHEKSPFHCHFCRHVFTNKRSLYSHYNKYHADEFSANKELQVGIKRQQKTRIKFTVKRKAEVKSSARLNNGQNDYKSMDDNDDNDIDKGDDDEEWKPHQNKRHESAKSRKQAIHSKPENNHRNSPKKRIEKISCPLCLQFECSIDEREKLCEHLEMCEGNSDNDEVFQLLENSCPFCCTYKCSIAGKIDFIEHLMTCRGITNDPSEQVSSLGRIYKCSICPTPTYMKLDTFLEHFLFHKYNIYKCIKCPRRFRLTSSLHSHWKRVHQDSRNVQHLHRYITDCTVPEIPWWCYVCNEKFFDNESRDFHVQTNHQQEVLKVQTCSQCSKGFSSVEELKLHQGISHSSRSSLYNCDICQEGFLTSKLRKLHERDKHNTGRFVCDVCGIECSSQNSFSMHLQLHQEVRNFVCDECGQSFTSSQYLRNHKYREHVPADDSINPLTCSTCKKTFHSVPYLKKHIMSVHEKKLKYFCDKCGKGYLEECRLKRHLTMSHGIGERKKHVCPFEDCKKEFWMLNKYKIHMSRHRNEPQYKCEYCGKEFFCSGRLRRHEKIHINAETKPYQCEICSKRFPLRDYLYIHMRSHNKKKQNDEAAN